MWRSVIKQTPPLGKPVTMTDGRLFRAKATTRSPSDTTGYSGDEPSPMTAEKPRHLNLRLARRCAEGDDDQTATVGDDW